MTKYCFVLDADGKPLSPTKEVKGWYMIRKGKAKLVLKYPMTIQLNRVIPADKICKDEVRMGIDDGGLHTGIAIVQKCQTKNKVLFKSTVEQRNDVKRLIDVRRDYRRYHRQHKRHRKARFNNRSSSMRKGRIAPSIMQKRQATMRVIYHLNKWINITTYWVEYTFKNGETHRGYVTALYPELDALNFQSPTKHCKKVSAKKCKLLWKFSKIYWLESA